MFVAEPWEIAKWGASFCRAGAALGRTDFSLSFSQTLTMGSRVEALKNLTHKKPKYKKQTKKKAKKPPKYRECII